MLVIPRATGRNKGCSRVVIVCLCLYFDLAFIPRATGRNKRILPCQGLVRVTVLELVGDEPLVAGQAGGYLVGCDGTVLWWEYPFVVLIL